MKQTARKRPAKTIDGYLALLDAERRLVLERLRRTIRRIVPDAEECISYGIPAFRWNGTVFAGFMNRSGGCSYLPFSGSTLSALARHLTGYERTKSSLHFSPQRPLPATLVRRLIKARIAEIRSR